MVQKLLSGLLLSITFMFSTKVQAIEVVYPDSQWEQATPQSMGFNPNLFNEAMNFFRSKYSGDQMAVVRSGKMVYRGKGSKKAFGLFSCTKSFTSTVLGILIDDGVVSLTDKPAQKLSFLKSKYSKMEFKHLATMTSGYDAVGGSYGPSNQDGSKTPFNPSNPSFPPESHYAYWDDAMNLFGLGLSQYAGKNFSEIFRSRIANKIQMENFSWSNNFKYNNKSIATGAGSGGGVKIHSEDFLRYCYLMLRMGSWKGKQLLSQEWVRTATREVQVPASMKVHKKSQNWIATGHYGFNWWINGQAGETLLWPDLPHDAFAARGVRGNFCIVIPSKELLIARVGSEGSNSNSLLNEIIYKILKSIE